MPIETRPFDAAEILAGDLEMQQMFLDEALGTGDAGDIKRALGTIARAQNMTALASEAGLSREGLRKALSADGNPTLSTLIDLSAALGMKLFRSEGTAQAKRTRRSEGAKASKVGVRPSPARVPRAA